MRYMGSKRRLGDHLLNIMFKERGSRPWVEPFVGGANMISKVGGVRIGSDVNKYVIALLQAVQRGWEPPSEVPEELWRDVRSNKDNYDDALVGFVGICCSYGSRFFNGYGRSRLPDGSLRNLAAESFLTLKSQRLSLIGVTFVMSSYIDLAIPDNSLIYCDPPYEGTTGYTVNFDHTSFWDWCRCMRRKGHLVYVSEYKAPLDFECVFELKQGSNLANSNRVNPTQIVSSEKLFRLP